MANTHSLDLESGSSQYASITDGSQTGLDLSTDFTIEGWFNFESKPTSGNIMYMVAKWNTSSQRAYALQLWNDTGTMKLLLSTSDDGSVAANITSNWDPTLSTWYHVAVAYDLSAGQAFMYVDTSSIGTPTGGDTVLHNSTGDFTLGSVAGGGSYYDGLMDEVRVWSDIRTAGEISANWKTESPAGNNLQGHWKLNNNYNDSSGNSNTLTGQAAPVFSTDVPFVEAVNRNYAYFM